jgi:ATP diphosphatase
VIDKVAEEARELVEARDARDPDATEAEFGDLLFVVANLARHLKLDPETAVRRTNAKFERRFREVERRLAAQGRAPGEASLAEMDALWEAAKAEERAAGAL